MPDPIFLEVKWTVSRGRVTYGYNICTLTDTSTGKRFRCNGGGYDMLGTVFGEWLQETHQSALFAMRDWAHRFYFLETQMQTNTGDFLYGMTFHQRKETLSQIALDGACGIESMRRIAEAIGLHTRSVNNRKGHTIGYIVTEGDES